MNEELQELIVQGQLHKGSKSKKIDGRWYEVYYLLGKNAVSVHDFFNETVTEYTVTVDIKPLQIKSTAKLSPFLRVAEELEREFGSQRTSKKVEMK